MPDPTPCYLTGLEVLQAFSVQDLSIEISDSPTELRHLILTGPNGSGKSSVLLGLFKELAGFPHGDGTQALKRAQKLAGIRAEDADRRIRELQDAQSEAYLGPLVAARGPSAKDYRAEEHVLVFLESSRNFNPQKVTGPKAVDIKSTPYSRNLSDNFLQYLVNRRTEQALAREDGDQQTADAIALWFDDLTLSLRELFGEPELELELDRKSYEYRIVLGGERPTLIHHLPDGFRSALQIWAEILLHYETLELELGHAPTGYVLIDELELHLHAELQERILPFLTRLFPTLQFIVSTHSPAVASSIDDATVFDLRTREAVPSAELRGQRYGDLFTGWFGIETDYDLETTRELGRLRSLFKQRPAPGSPERTQLEELSARLASRSHLLALQVWRELEAEGD